MEVKAYISKDGTYITKNVNFKKRNAVVFLEKADDETAIHCMYCKKKLFKTKYRIYQVVPGTPPNEMTYIRIKCPNSMCNSDWWFIPTF